MMNLGKNGRSTRETDVTGEKRITWNILSSWIGQMVFLVAGFVMPRMIDRHVGQNSLGIWDFSWSLVSYFSLMGLGVGSSVNRYVASLRAAGDKEGLDEAISSVVCIQAAIAVAIGIVTAVLVGNLPHFFREHTIAELSDARWVVGLLGATLAVQQGFDAFRGVMTGCHRWDLHNGINAVSYGITVVLMIFVLSLGHGLRSIAGVYLFVAVAAEAYRYRAVRKICPEAEIGIRKATWKQAGEMLAFGVKTIVIGIPGLIITQGSSLLIVRHLGPAILAVFSRPVGLLGSAQTFIDKYAYVLTPTTGSLQGAGKDREIRDLMFRATRYSVALSWPVVLFLSILGEAVLQLWMGPRYDPGWVMTILAAGCFLRMTQSSSMTMLVGLNAHGGIGAMNLLIAIASMGIGAVVLQFTGWSLTGVAAMISSYRLIQGASIILYSCRRLSIPLGEYFLKSFLGPLAAGAPLAVALFAVRYAFRSSPLFAVATGCAAAGLILAPIYWKHFLPQELKDVILRFPGVGGMARRLGVS